MLKSIIVGLSLIHHCCQRRFKPTSTSSIAIQSSQLNTFANTSTKVAIWQCLELEILLHLSTKSTYISWVATLVAMRQYGEYYRFQFTSDIQQLFIWQYTSKMDSGCILQ